MRPGRLGRSAQSGSAAAAATRPHPSRRLAAELDSRRLASRTARNAYTGPHVRARRRRRAGPAGEGREPRAGSRVDRREERRAPRRRRPARRARRPRSSPPTPPTSTRPRPAGMAAAVRSTGCASPTPGSRAWPTGSRRSPRCPTRSARCSTAGRGPNGLQIERVRVPLGVVGDHLREPAQRHQRRRRALPEVGQRRAPARLVGARCARTSPIADVLRDGARQGRAARRRGAARRGHRATRPRSSSCSSRDYVDCLIPRGGPVAHPEHPRQRHRARHHRRRRQLPRLRRRRRRPRRWRSTIVVNAKTQRPSVCNAAESLVVHEAVADAFLPARRATRCVEQGVELVGDAGARGARPAHRRRHRRRLRPRVPRPQDVRSRSSPTLDAAIDHVNRLRHRPHRGDPHRATSTPPAGSPTRSTPPRWS